MMAESTAAMTQRLLMRKQDTATILGCTREGVKNSTLGLVDGIFSVY